MSNALTQVMAAGEIKGISEMREVVSNSIETKTFLPRNTEQWEEHYPAFLMAAGIGEKN